MDETTGKILIALISVISGLIAGQGMRLIQTWWTNRKIIKSLLTELEDIRHRLKQMSDSYQYSLKFFAHKAVEPAFPSKLSHPVYTKHYTDIFLKLNHSQRNSYELIHGLVDAINKVIDFETELVRQFTIEYDENLFNKWGNTMKAQYTNIHELWWHINFHLNTSDNPNLIEINPEAEKHYKENAERTYRHINQIIEHAKTVDFDKIRNSNIELVIGKIKHKEND